MIETINPSLHPEGSPDSEGEDISTIFTAICNMGVEDVTFSSPAMDLKKTLDFSGDLT